MASVDRESAPASGGTKRFAARLKAAAMAIVAAAAVAFAGRGASAAVASGTAGTCAWTIDDAGTLTVSPRNGTSGRLDSYTSGNGPWYAYRNSIKKVVVEPGVATGAGCQRLFYALSACEEMDVANLDTSTATTTRGMFEGCSALASLDVSSFDARNVSSAHSMFANCSGLEDLSLCDFRSGALTNMIMTFSGCSSLTSIDVGAFDTRNVTSISSAFFKCEKLASLDLRGWDVGSVTNMDSTFSNCGALASLDLRGWETARVTSMTNMFSGCGSLGALDLSSFDTRSLTKTSFMFNGCAGLSELDVTNFDVSRVTNMQGMFQGCSGLTRLDLSCFDDRAATNRQSMFANCPNLSEVDLGENFVFKNASGPPASTTLPKPPTDRTTGKWIREDETFGPYTQIELRDAYEPRMAGKWIWQEPPTKYRIRFLPPEGAEYAGSMPDQKAVAAQDAAIDACAFYRFDYHFAHWEGDDGNVYADGQTIPAGTFRPDDVLVLTATFEKDDDVATFSEGEADLWLRGGEKATFPGVPGGTTYQILEETPSGWQLVAQSGAAGAVPPNGEARATFTNEYVPGTATIALAARKTLDGRAPAAGAFAFVLEGEGERMEATNGDSGLVTFEPLTFRAPGTYEYAIREVRGDDPGISYDPREIAVTVTVSDDGRGNLTASSSLGGEVPVFENETKPGTLTVTKIAEGQGSGEEVFTFEVVLTNERGMPLDGAYVSIG